MDMQKKGCCTAAQAKAIQSKIRQKKNESTTRQQGNKKMKIKYKYRNNRITEYQKNKSDPITAITQQPNNWTI